MSTTRSNALRAALCGLLLFMSPTFVRGEAGSEIPSESEQEVITALVEQLGAAKYRDRKRAENELRTKGLLALESLRAVRNHEDIEIRLRARDLARELRGQFIQQGIPPELQALLRNYEAKQLEQRRSLIRRLANKQDLSSCLVLARLARFDESDLLAREAALSVIVFDFDEQDDPEQAIRSAKSALGFSRRIPVLWIRSHLLSYSDPETALREFAESLTDERERVAVASASTNKSVVDRMSRLNVDMLLRAGKKQAAFDAMRELDIESTPTSLLLSFEWMLEREAWEVIEEFAEKHKKSFEKNALLLYRLAEVKRRNDKPEEAEATAGLAFDAAGEKLLAYASMYRRTMFAYDRVIRQTPQDIGARRYVMARILEDEFGLFKWSEREYRAAIDAEVLSRSRFDMQAMNDLSLMLHDQQDEKGAVEIVERLIETIEKSDDNRKDFEQQFSTIPLDHLRSRLVFYKSSLVGKEDDSAEQRKLLDEALRLEPEDVDVVIAMYRVKDAPEEYRKKTLKLLEEYEKRFVEESVSIKQRLKVASANERNIIELELARKQNQYAWLVGNTEGDVDAAIAASHESVRTYERLSPSQVWVHLDTLGRAYYRKGDFKNAVRYQRRAAKAMPNEGQIMRQLRLFEDALAKQSESQVADES